jgi:hypothetical protein
MPEIIQNPINAFSEDMQKLIYAYSEAKGYPTEYFLQSVLGAVSTAIGRSVVLNTGNYTAIGSLWCIILGRKGYTKSESLDDAFKPIRKHQFELQDKYRGEMDEWEEWKANNPKDKSKPPPEPAKHVVNDTTPEKLVIMLSNNPKGIGMVYDEISGFVGRFNRYAAGGDEQMFLTLFNGSSVMRDRINGVSAYAKHTYLTIIGTTQPSILNEVFSGKSQSGFFDRWIISQPDGFKKQYPNQFGINPIDEAKYERMILSLLYQEFKGASYEMKYPPESYTIVNDFQKYMVDQQNETENDDYRGILAKMEIYLHKFALLLQCIEWVNGGLVEEVSPQSATGAVILTKYFIDQAQKVRIMNPIDMLKNEWKEIYMAMPEHGINFTRAQFVKKCADFGLKQRQADNFLRDNAERSETKLLYKIGQGNYTKNLF